MAAEQISLDARDLEPPEPYELATATLKGLRPGQFVHLLIPRLPRLLYPWLAEHGFSVITHERDDDLFELYIWSTDDRDTAVEINKNYLKNKL